MGPLEKHKKFEEDAVVQAYVAILRELIALPGIFAQGTGLKETASYLKEVLQKAGAQVILDESYAAPFCWLLLLVQRQMPRP